MKENYLKNKVALISGSSMGIGKAIAFSLAEQGAKIVLNGCDEKKLERVKNEFLRLGFEVISVAADIRYPVYCKMLVKRAIAKFGRLDILVNNAAVSSRGSVEDMAATNFKVLADTNFLGSASLSKYAVPYLKETKGHIIFINSAGGFRGMPFNSAYSVTKMAQAGIADALRIELNDAGIHVGIAFVGFTENDPKKKILDVYGSWVYLPERTNIKLVNPHSVAQSIALMIIHRKNKITLTGLGKFSNFAFRYLPQLSNWLLLINRNKIEREFTLIGGQQVNEKIISNNNVIKSYHDVNMEI